MIVERLAGSGYMQPEYESQYITIRKIFKSVHREVYQGARSKLDDVFKKAD